MLINWHNERRNKSSRINNTDIYIEGVVKTLCAMSKGRSIVCAIGTPYAKARPVVRAELCIVISRVRPITSATGDISGIS
jgi:hypothetical protein